MNLVSISQPTYIGHKAHYQLINQADTHIILDTVPISKQSWQTRNRIRQPDGTITWLSIPVHAHVGQALNDVEIDNTTGWQRKHWATIEHAYKGAEAWDSVAHLKPYYTPTEMLTDFTINLTEAIIDALGITTETVWASTLGPMPQGRTERLIGLLRAVQATGYLTVAGATYLEGATHLGDTPITYLDHEETKYDQGGQEWAGHLSIIDTLAYNGWRTTIHPKAGLPSTP